MTLHHEDKVKWLDTVWAAIADAIKKEDQEHPSTLPTYLSPELSQFVDDLLSGFQSATGQLAVLQPKAADQFNQWVLENGPHLEGIFQLDPLKLSSDPLAFSPFIRKVIPHKFLSYLFFAGQQLYLGRHYQNSLKVFRLLTLLSPENGEYLIWLALSQQSLRLPEITFIPLLKASLLNPADPTPHFHMAQSWMLLKKWEEMRGALMECLKIIGDNPFQYPLKVKCEEWLNSIPAIASGKVVIPPLYQIPLSSYPLENINKLFKEPNTPEQEGLQLDLNELVEQLQIKLDKVAKTLGTSCSRVQNSFGFFEKRSIRLSEQGVEFPSKTFSIVEKLVTLFFLGTLAIGSQITRVNRILLEALNNVPIHVAYKFSSLLERTPLPEEEIIKHLYVCDTAKGIVINQMMKNPSYGSEDRPYEEDREKGLVRVSRFLKEDIVGKSIIDFGCNEGSVLFACQAHGASSLIGLDLSHRCIENAKRYAADKNLCNIQFLEGDMENSAFLSTLPQADTVLLLAILDTSHFVNKTAVLARVSQFAKHTLYYEGHLFNPSHVGKLYELLMSTTFTRFHYLGTFERRPLIRCSREILTMEDMPPNAVTSDAAEADLLEAEEIYLFTDSPKNPAFSKKCRLIQFVQRPST